MNSLTQDWDSGNLVKDKDISCRQALRVLTRRKNRLRKKLDHLIINNPELIASEAVSIIYRTEQITQDIKAIYDNMKYLDKIYKQKKEQKKNPVQNKMAGRNTMRVT